MRDQCTATKNSLCSPQLEKACCSKRPKLSNKDTAKEKQRTKQRKKERKRNAKEKLLLREFQVQLSFPGGSDGKESAWNAGHQVWSLGQENSWRRKWQLTPVFLPGKSQDRGDWWATVYGVAELDTTKWLTLFFHFQLQLPGGVQENWSSD